MTDSTPVGYPFLTTSKFLIPLSLLAILLNIGPLVWHIRSRNIPTSSILAWIIILNLINFINAIIWHNDDPEHWWRGFYLCDIEVRLIVGASVGLSGAALCLAQSLARVLDTEHQKSIMIKHQWVKDALLCWALPIWFMVVYYAVQTIRYTIGAGYGCGAPFSTSWVTIVLIYMWPVILMVITCYYTSQSTRCAMTS
jgi:pheromone a factor receptor